jgi:hypothetical protein
MECLGCNAIVCDRAALIDGQVNRDASPDA